MAEVGPGKIPTGVVVEPVDDRARIGAVFFVAQIHRSVGGEHEAVARHARRQHAVKHVHAERNHLEQLRRSAETHRVTRLVRRQEGRRRAHLFQHLRLRLAHAHAAHRVSGKVQRRERLRRLATQVVERRALHDGEDVMAGREKAALGGDRAALARPPQTSRHGTRARVAFAGPRRTFVDDHRDVAAEVLLDRHDLARPEKQFRPVEVRLKRHAVVPDIAQLRERENLEPAAVGQDRSVPAHKTVQPTKVADQLAARPQVEMIGVAQDDLRTDLVQVCGRQRLHCALGADRHEDRRLDRAMARRQSAPPGGRGGVGLDKLERRGHARAPP